MSTWSTSCVHCDDTTVVAVQYVQYSNRVSIPSESSAICGHQNAQCSPVDHNDRKPRTPSRTQAQSFDRPTLNPPATSPRFSSSASRGPLFHCPSCPLFPEAAGPLTPAFVPLASPACRPLLCATSCGFSSCSPRRARAGLSSGRSCEGSEGSEKDESGRRWAFGRRGIVAVSWWLGRCWQVLAMELSRPLSSPSSE